jgi:hypothetical protein
MGKKGFKHTEETKAKMRNRKVSEETRDKIRKARKKFWASENGKKTKEKIRESNRRRKVSEETGRKISLSLCNSVASYYVEFIKFVLNQIYTKRSGLIMANMAKKFVDIIEPGNNLFLGGGTLRINKQKFYEVVGVYIRVYLESNGYINYAPLNSFNRRIKFISTTPKFPSSKDELESLLNETSRYVRYRRRGLKQNK